MITSFNVRGTGEDTGGGQETGGREGAAERQRIADAGFALMAVRSEAEILRAVLSAG